jgi:hypothetical protein
MPYTFEASRPDSGVLGINLRAALIFISFDSRRTPPDELDVEFAQRRTRLEALQILPLLFTLRALLLANLTTNSPHHS